MNADRATRTDRTYQRHDPYAGMKMVDPYAKKPRMWPWRAGSLLVIVVLLTAWLTGAA
jgi:hypothetical protein